MNSYKIKPKIVHGISTDVPNSVQFLSNNEVIYPSGGVFTIHNVTDNSQRFVQIMRDPDKVVNLISIHPKKTFLAISSTTPKPKIEIYDLCTRTLVRSHPVLAPVITMCYSWDGGHLMYVTDESVPIMYYYSFELKKVENSTAATQPPAYSGPVKMIAGNPTDSMIVVIVGNGLFRLLNLSDSVWRQYGFKKADQYNFLSVCWISTERLIAGTSDGRIILVDSGELKAIYRADDTDLIMFASNKEQLQAMMMNNTLAKSCTQKDVFSILRFRDGFAFTILPNIVILFEKESSSDIYVKKNVFITSSDQIPNVLKGELDKIFSLSISPDDKKMLFCTCRAQLFSVNLSDKETPDKIKIQFTPLIESLHYGEVKTLSICSWKPLIMTSGMIDRRVCLYNYETNKLLFSQIFNNDIHSLVLHPTGLFCIISFTDACQVAYIMMGRLELGKKLSSEENSEDYSPLRSCKVMEFSLYGTILAVADGVHIKLYDYIQFNLMFSLLGHRIEITSFKWISKDNILLSCGLDGAVYVWDAKHGKRMADIVTRNCRYQDIEATSDGNLIYTVGEDGHLKEIKNEAIIQDLEVTSCSLTCIVMSKNDHIVVISNERGLVMVVNYPIVQKVDFDQYCVHTTAVSQMKMTYENTGLVTCDKSGMVCFWVISNADGVELPPPKNLYRCPDIFISEDELLEKNNTIINLKARLNEVEFEHKIKLKKLHKSYEDKMNKLKTEKDNTTLMLNEKISFIEKKNEKNTSIFQLEKKEMSEIYEKELEAIEKHLKYNLYIRECEKNQSLEDEISRTLKTHNEQVLALKNQHKQEFNAQISKKDTEFSVLLNKLKDLQETVRKEVENQNLMKELVEEDADRTILEIQQIYEVLIQEENKKYTNLKHHVGVYREEIKALEKGMENSKAITTKLNEKINHLQILNIDSDSRISELLTEIVERDNIVISKERRVHEMKLRAEDLKQELQILKMKISEINKVMKPKDEKIEELDLKIITFKQELFEKEQEIKWLQLKKKYLEESLHARDIEHKKSKQRQSELRSLVNMIKNDIHDVHQTMKDMNTNRLKRATQKLYEKYVRANSEEIIKEMKSVACENIQHQKQLDSTIRALRRQLAREKAGTSTELRVLKHILNADEVCPIEEIAEATVKKMCVVHLNRKKAEDNPNKHENFEFEDK